MCSLSLLSIFSYDMRELQKLGRETLYPSLILKMHHRTDNFPSLMSLPLPFPHCHSLLISILTFVSLKSLVHKTAKVMLQKPNLDHVIPQLKTQL